MCVQIIKTRTEIILFLNIEAVLSHNDCYYIFSSGRILNQKKRKCGAVSVYLKEGSDKTYSENKHNRTPHPYQKRCRVHQIFRYKVRA